MNPLFCNVRYIFFDVGSTISNEDYGMALRFDKQASTAEAKALGVTADDIRERLYALASEGKQDFYRVARSLGLTDIIPYDPSHEQLYPGTVPALTALSEHYRMGIIANQCDGLLGRLERFGILGYFDTIISSFDVKLQKPDPAIFRLAMEKAGVKACECVMVGDRPDNDIFPAKALGMKTVWLKQSMGAMQRVRGPEYAADAEADDIAGVEALLLPR
ncbi:MAG: HAD family hydrolase [Clostridiales bacterium]|nr:HAD family hydrolase [Clostridiales bacterium]